MVRHFDIEIFGSKAKFFRQAAHGILQLTLDEERMTDQGLTLIAQNRINWEVELEPAKGNK